MLPKLETEIERVRSEIAVKLKAREGADAVFKS